jgi:nicotinate-nucleotide adenylyltransferase
MKVGLLGGTFDPPHLGHLILAELSRQQLQLDKVLFVPAGDPWRKAHREVTPAHHRVAMTRLCIAGNDDFELDEREVKREGPTYTVDTLRELRGELDVNDEIYFIAGEDALADMPRWREPEQIAMLARIAVAPRRDAPMPEDLPFDVGDLRRIDMPLIEISSTELRERAKSGLSLRYLVPDAVNAYICEQGLYSPSS